MHEVVQRIGTRSLFSVMGNPGEERGQEDRHN